MALATIGGGCFWCLEAVFQPLRGITQVVSGYAGGHTDQPTYKDVCSGMTGHAEVVQLTFDRAVLPYRDLLELFFAFHDPTTPDQQGPDVGSQYRSVIFTHSPEQLTTARTGVRTTYVADSVLEHALAIVRATREDPRIQLGASSRAALTLVRCAQARALLTGRDYVVPDDTKVLAPSVLAHRLVLADGSSGSGMVGSRAEALVADLVTRIPVPVQ